MANSTDIPAETVRKWQEIVDLLAEIMHVPAALVMRAEPPQIKVFVASESKGNPYEAAESASLNTGLYCETVMKTREPLLVPDALADADWDANPDIKLGMISYLGVPISWPDGEIFGTICVLDSQRNDYSETFLRLLCQWRDVLQTDLRTLATLNRKLEENERKSEQRYRELETALAHANRVSTLGHLAASISHEIQQPIAACATNAAAGIRWLSASTPNIDEARKAFERVTQDAKRAGEVMTRIRMLVKRAPTDKEFVQINDAIRDVVALSRGEAVKAGVSVTMQLGDALPLVQCDRVQVQQVILNLVINAIEAMSASQSVTRHLTIVTRRGESNAVVVSVCDSGPGIAAEHIARLFEPFYTTKTQGMGMGLSICRSIVQAHGGTLELGADTDDGAAFDVTFPIDQASARGSAVPAG